MGNFAKKRALSSLGILILLVFILACDTSFFGRADEEAEMLKLQLTQQSLQITQAALSDNSGFSNQVQQGNQESDQNTSEQDEQDDDIPCNDSHIISETIKDGTKFQPGETFKKSWTLRNEGDCDWTTSYYLKFVEGTQMGGPSTVKVPSVIEPNEDITFILDLTAPNTAGDYTGVWQLFAADGEAMGRYWVKISVGAPPQNFAVTSVTFYAGNQPIDLICPECIDVSAEITVTAAGTVTYTWEDCEGGAENGSLTFNAPGKKQITHALCIPAAGSGFHWADLYIDEPNHQWFNSPDFEVVCNP